MCKLHSYFILFARLENIHKPFSRKFLCSSGICVQDKYQVDVLHDYPGVYQQVDAYPKTNCIRPTLSPDFTMYLEILSAAITVLCLEVDERPHGLGKSPRWEVRHSSLELVVEALCRKRDGQKSRPHGCSATYIPRNFVSQDLKEVEREDETENK